MKKHSFFFAITLLFFPVKGDIQIPLKPNRARLEETDPLKGKPKTLVLNLNGAPSLLKNWNTILSMI